MLDSFNDIFHFFYLAFFLSAAGLFWILDRRRWHAYRQAATALKLKFSRQAPSPGQRTLQADFVFFKREHMVEFSAFFQGNYAARFVQVFNYCFQGKPSEKAFRRGFACLVIESKCELPTLQLWPRSRPTPFSSQTESLEGFFPDQHLRDLFHIRGRNGMAVSQLLGDRVADWLCQHPTLVIECSQGHILLSREAEWKPDQIEQVLQVSLSLLELMETHLISAPAAL